MLLARTARHRHVRRWRGAEHCQRSARCRYAVPMIRKAHSHPRQPARHGVARVISKLGLGSRTQAAQWVREGRVRVNGLIVHDAECPVHQGTDRVEVDEREIEPAALVVLMLNKPRGLVTTRQDEQGRETVYRCFEGAALPWLAPVGRLDKASEGLLLFCNDPAWAAGITAPGSGPGQDLPCADQPRTRCRVACSIQAGHHAGPGIVEIQIAAHSARPARRTRGWKSPWMKAATARSVACSRLSMSRRCAWCA